MRLLSSFDFSPRDWRIPSEFVRCLFSSLSRSFPLLIVAASLVAALPGSAQDASGTTAAATSYAVRGTIVNATSGQPVARALVALNEDNAMLTGSEGEFSFDNIPAGEYSVSVQKPGYSGLGGMMAGIGAMVTRYSMGGRRLQTAPPRRIQVGPDMPALNRRSGRRHSGPGLWQAIPERPRALEHRRAGQNPQRRLVPHPRFSARHVHRYHAGFPGPATFGQQQSSAGLGLSGAVLSRRHRHCRGRHALPHRGPAG